MCLKLFHVLLYIMLICVVSTDILTKYIDYGYKMLFYNKLTFYVYSQCLESSGIIFTIHFPLIYFQETDATFIWFKRKTLKLTCTNINTSPCLIKQSFSLCTFCSVLMSCLILFVRDSPGCGQWEGSEQFKMRIYEGQSKISESYFISDKLFLVWVVFV